MNLVHQLFNVGNRVGRLALAGSIALTACQSASTTPTCGPQQDWVSFLNECRSKSQIQNAKNCETGGKQQFNWSDGTCFTVATSTSTPVAQVSTSAPTQRATAAPVPTVSALDDLIRFSDSAIKGNGFSGVTRRVNGTGGVFGYITIPYDVMYDFSNYKYLYTNSTKVKEQEQKMIKDRWENYRGGFITPDGRAWLKPETDRIVISGISYDARPFADNYTLGRPVGLTKDEREWMEWPRRFIPSSLERDLKGLIADSAYIAQLEFSSFSVEAQKTSSLNGSRYLLDSYDDRFKNDRNLESTGVLPRALSPYYGNVYFLKSQGNYTSKLVFSVDNDTTHFLVIFTRDWGNVKPSVESIGSIVNQYMNAK